MTTVPARPPTPPVLRPTAPPASGGGGALATIDPLRLINKHKWTLLGAALGGLVLGLIVHVVWLATYPIYTPYIIYECFPIESGDPGEMGPAPGREEDFKRFMATQVQVMTSEAIIRKAVTDPRFPAEAPSWSARFLTGGVLDHEAAAKELRKKLSAGILGESNLIRLSFWWKDRTEATAIVRAVGRAYEEDRRWVATRDINDRKQLITRSIETIEAQIRDRSRQRERLMAEKSLESLDERLSEASLAIENAQELILRVRAEREALIVRRNQLQAELESQAGIRYPDDLRKRVEDDPLILRLKQDINDTEAFLIALVKRGVAPEHRDRRNITNRLEGMRQQLDAERERLLREAFDGLLESLRAEIASLEAQEADLTRKLEDAKARAIELTQIRAQVKDIDQDIERLTANKAEFLRDLQRIEVATGARSQTRVYRVQDAIVPHEASFPRLVFMLPLGLLLGLGLTTGGVVVSEIADQRVKGAADVALIPRTRVLGIIPHASEDPAQPQRVETVFRDLPSGVLAESFRQLRGTVLKALSEGGHRSLLIVSGLPGSGATTTAVNLACALGGADQRVLLVDANFRRPGIHNALGLGESPGLGEVLGGLTPLEAAVQPTANANVHVLASGAAGHRQYERLATGAMSELLRQAGERYDVVIVDTAPAVVAGDALALAARCDASLLVVRALVEKRGLVARLRNELGEAHARFLGVVINAVRSSAGGYLRRNIQATHRYQNHSSTGTGQNERRAGPAA